MTVTFMNLLPEQHPTLFPRKKNAKGQTVNTSKTVWVTRDGRRAEVTVVRKPEDIDGLALHQTACVFGKGKLPTRYHRALKVAVPVVGFNDGTFVHSAPLLWYLYSSNGLNPRTYALECEGHYSGLLDDPTTPRREDQESIWKGDAPTPLTPIAIETFRAAFLYLYEEGRKLGSPLKYLWAHRQASADRRSDPGEGVWGEVGEWGAKECGLEIRYADVFGDGRPIPREWAPAGFGVGKY